MSKIQPEIIEIIEKTITLIYDEYECTYGDGFYPLLPSNDPSSFQMITIEITFELINNIWKQKKEIPTKPCSITGLDGDTGINLLNLLNNNRYLGKYITNKNNQQIYPKIKF